MRLARFPLVIAILTCALDLAAVPAAAQTAPAPRAPRSKKDLRIPIAVLDARGVFARLGQDPITASGLSAAALDLPTSGLGVAGGAQVYLWRGAAMAFGVGGEAIMARGAHDLVDSAGKPTGTTIDRRLRSASANLSLNFGHRNGWSYLTVGMGPTSFESYVASSTPDGLRETSLNFGGGARWFNWTHLAFTADMRFYRTKLSTPTLHTAGRSGGNVVVFSGGIAIK